MYKKSKALLVGNGITSQLITAYRDETMIDKFTSIDCTLYERINQDFDVFRNIGTENSKEYSHEIIERIGKIKRSSQFAPSTLYKEYFCEYGLEYEINKPKVLNIENLLKIAKLFQYDDSTYNKIKSIANKIYYNNGEYGINSIDKSETDIEKLKIYLNSFEFVFTTNYDYLLDELYVGDIIHLHGGFSYYKELQDNSEIHIKRTSSVISPDKAHLIWGINADEKERQMEGGFTFDQFSFPINFSGESILKKHFDKLKTMKAEEIHIWGHSGLNDTHINDCISQNSNIAMIYKYCNPIEELDNNIYKNSITNVFHNSKPIIFKSWNEIWDIIN